MPCAAYPGSVCSPLLSLNSFPGVNINSINDPEEFRLAIFFSSYLGWIVCATQFCIQTIGSKDNQYIRYNIPACPPCGYSYFKKVLIWEFRQAPLSLKHWP